ncbi:glycosyl transferase [Prosthecochloris sp. ZM]|uniref:glycosyltransferase family 4 protein n=1 Tax=Prosthecochloris sp. ZM TaxID=2283143 RepID=UPI000DF72267|nr:glycosyltransferase family 4 protein [Prosthecochloris sp. ZM]RDD30387.1 glycosyl transferase [Prosthecochloris sp. ZM]
MDKKNKNATRYCIFYAAGPGDIVSTFANWKRGIDDPHQVAVTYSSLFFDTCRSLGAKGIAISSCPRADTVTTEQFHVENLPKPPQKSGLAFHFQQIAYVMTILRKAVDAKADILVMADSTGHFFPLEWFAPASLYIIPSLHCTLWPRSKNSSLITKIIARLNRGIFRRRALAILCLSHDIRKQLLTITGNTTVPIYPFIPHYRRDVFATLPPPPQSSTFRLIYAGRMETEKGIDDLLEVAVTLSEKKIDSIEIHLCGNGSQEARLRTDAEHKGVTHLFHIHGYCQRPEMLNYLGNSHAVIVPTRSSFEEGFNKVVAEAILAGRPVITSSVCPALEYVRDAVVEVPPDNAQAYFEAAVELSSNTELYNSKQRGCRKVQEQFYDPEQSWGAALESIIRDRADG